MPTSVFDVFKIGIGPSSSHTVGPMRAADRFARKLTDEHLLEATARVLVQLYGSLGATGKGHHSDKAILMGLEGASPETVEPTAVNPRCDEIARAGRLRLGGTHEVDFSTKDDLLFNRGKRLPGHSNGMQFTAFDGAGGELLDKVYYSVGGGFIADAAPDSSILVQKLDLREFPYEYSTGAELLALCARDGLAIWELVLANECVLRPEPEVRAGVERLWAAFQDCVRRGIRTDGELPGGLHVRRRAPLMHRSLTENMERHVGDPMAALDWVSLYALAVNEENAAGGRVVTAPTNGAAGIIPSVLHYYHRFCKTTPDGVFRFILTAAGVCHLYIVNASISGAEVGCQGEVGVACSMAAAGLTAALGGTNAQIENAAEIGMEHNLGLTCDPIGGLVQIPCIERNAMGAVKAINASRLAMLSDGEHKVSLDKVIRTMARTGRDMATKYKETSRGGLAVNVVEC
ncbi:MAG: L-serine ammonia-lyase [Candidatus Sumerlaeia bacterium]|nr:L-serine ammonia-lyase [Candidatus Sumerlaeia bacterium]